MSSNYFLKLSGGQNLSDRRPVFTKNNLVLIPSENSVLGYSCKSGKLSLISKLKTDHEFFHEINVCVCLHPVLKDFQFFSFTKNGTILNWNYLDSSLIKSYKLSLKDSKIKTELVWATAKNYFYDGENHIVFYYAIKEYFENEAVYSVYASSVDSLENSQLLITQNVFNEQRISFGRNQNYLVSIDNTNIYYIKLKHGFLTEDNIEPRKLRTTKPRDPYEIVSCNPINDSVAYTSNNGEIKILFFDEKDDNITKTKLHWHQMPVTDICFSTNGIYLYSVGYESVVVRWNLDSYAKNFISNVGYSIKYIANDETNSCIAITLHNNEIRFISSYFDVINCNLNNLTFMEDKKIETGIVYDPKHDSIVLNSKPGYLQFYSPLREENIFNLDVSESRFINKLEKKESKIINIDVYKLAISQCGNWLATYEMRDDLNTDLDTKLKFWKYQKNSSLKKETLVKNENYKLNTCINLPHKLKIQKMKFNRTSTFMVTTGQDKCYKIWYYNKDCNNWLCYYNSNFQQDLIPNHITISYDSSILAINFDHLLTVWNVKELNNVKYIDTFKASVSDNTNLNNHVLSNSYINLEFGTGMFSHLLIGCTSLSLNVWDISKLEKKWSYLSDDHEIKKMAFNPLTNNLVILNSNEDFYVFNINSINSQPLIKLQLDLKLNLDVDFLFFISQKNYDFKHEDQYFGELILCVMTEDKKLFILENQKTKENREKIDIKLSLIQNNNSKTTDFVKELIDRKTNFLKQGNYDMKENLSTGFSEKFNLSKIVDEMFYNVPSHVLPPIQLISKPFLKTLSSSNSYTNFKVNQKIENKSKIGMEIDSENE